MKNNELNKQIKNVQQRNGLIWEQFVNELATELTYNWKLKRRISFAKVENLIARNNKIQQIKEDILKLPLDDIRRFIR